MVLDTDLPLPTFLADLLLRYACYAMSLRETASGMLKVLSLITEIFNVVRAQGQMLHEAEIACIMPHLIDKSGKSNIARINVIKHEYRTVHCTDGSHLFLSANIFLPLLCSLSSRRT